ncbi:MAG: hypothetical protein ACXWTN_00715, partial [Methylosarcina sp.]
MPMLLASVLVVGWEIEAHELMPLSAAHSIKILTNKTNIENFIEVETDRGRPLVIVIRGSLVDPFRDCTG